MTTTLPTAVEGYVAATNAFDLDALIDCFADDAVVNDVRREFRGRAEIRAWLDRELVGDKVTMAVTAVSGRAGTVTVDAAMDGNYDKTGLPDPLVLTHYFTVAGPRIVQLIIIHNQPTPTWVS